MYRERSAASDVTDVTSMCEQMRLERRLAALEFDADTSGENTMVTTTHGGFTRTMTKAYEPNMEESSIVHVRDEKEGVRKDVTYFICEGRVVCEQDFEVSLQDRRHVHARRSSHELATTRRPLCRAILRPHPTTLKAR